MNLTFQEIRPVAAIVIFLVTYVVVAIGKLPGYRIDRAGTALLGASLVIGLDILTPEEAYRAIDFDTIALLLGMMIVVANLRVSGFFRIVAAFIAEHTHRPIALLGAVVLSSGVLSAFLVNDTICLLMTPLVLDITLRLKRNPIPYLLAIAMASNVGSVATITGNPQNMIVGGLSGISFWRFSTALAPVAMIGLAVVYLLIASSFRREFLTPERLPIVTIPLRVHRPLMVKTLFILTAMIALFFLGQPVAKVAITGGALLLLTRRVKPDKIYFEIDWLLLVMFIGLFIVVAALEKTIIGPDFIVHAAKLRLDSVSVLSVITAVLSNLVSNVPAILILKPFVASMVDPQRAWLVLAMASTLAGNFTLIGSVANLIVAQRAKASGVDLNFWTYFRVGAPVTLLTLLIGCLWLMLL